MKREKTNFTVYATVGLLVFFSSSAFAASADPSPKLNALGKTAAVTVNTLDGGIGLIKILTGALGGLGAAAAGPEAWAPGAAFATLFIAHGACDIGSAGMNIYMAVKDGATPKHITCLGKVTEATLKKLKVDPSVRSKIEKYSDLGDGVLTLAEGVAFFKLFTEGRPLIFSYRGYVDESQVVSFGLLTGKAVVEARHSTVTSQPKTVRAEAAN